MITSVRNAHRKYFLDLQTKSETKITEEKETQQALNEAAEKVKESAKKEQIAIINRDIKIKKSVIDEAEEMIQDGNKQLQNCLAKRNLNRKQIQQAQSKIEMGLKRKLHLEKEMGDLEQRKKKTKIVKQLRNNKNSFHTLSQPFDNRTFLKKRHPCIQAAQIVFKR